MTYQSFQATLLAELQGYFPPDTSITIQSIPRNNHIQVDGLTILESGFNITPTIYIQEYYEKLDQGQSFEAVFGQILDTYHTYRPMENIDPSFFSDFSNIQSHIVFKLIHYQRNLALLEQIPYIPFLDLAIVFYCLIPIGSAGNATILIKNSHLKLWNIDKQKLYLLAKQNTPFLMEESCEPLSRLLSGFLPADHDGSIDISGISKKEGSASPISMYVLTNQQRFLGAACLLYDELLFDLSKKLNSDFYIIPSSIHEVILIPASPDMVPEDFTKMICEVNDTQLEPEDILSDHVYYYSRKEKQITGDSYTPGGSCLQSAQ